jgi:hypothetical protein
MRRQRRRPQGKPSPQVVIAELLFRDGIRGGPAVPRVGRDGAKSGVAHLPRIPGNYPDWRKYSPLALVQGRQLFLVA